MGSGMSSSFGEIDSSIFGDFKVVTGVVWTEKRTQEGKKKEHSFAARIINTKTNEIVMDLPANDTAQLMKQRRVACTEAEWMAVPEHEKIEDENGRRMRIQVCPHCVKEEAMRAAGKELPVNPDDDDEI